MQAVLISIHPGWCKEIVAFLGYDNRRPLYKKRLELRKTASTYNNYILENEYVWKGNVPSDIFYQLAYIGVTK